MVWHFEKECIAFFPVLQTAVACEPIVTWSSRRSTLLSCFHVLVLWPKAWYLSCFILHKHSQGARNKCNLKSCPLINGLSSLIIFVLSKRLCTHILIPLIFLHLLWEMLACIRRKKQTCKMDGERERERTGWIGWLCKEHKAFLKTHFQLCVLLLFYWPPHFHCDGTKAPLVGFRPKPLLSVIVN